MKNAMDSILVRYGSYDSEPCTLSDFLQRTDLNPREQQGQKALAELYKLNQKEDLFERGFTEKDGTSLLIDFMPMYMDNAWGTYNPQAHRIDLGDEKEIPVSQLILIFAHELKHAEQFKERDISANTNLNSFQKHQLGFLREAQAYAFEQRVAYLCRKDSASLYAQAKLTAMVFGEETDEKNLEQKIMCRLLPNLYRGSYKDKYDNSMIILDTDKGLEQFPDYLNVGPEVAEVISRAPKKAKSIPNQIRQEAKNGRTDKIPDLLMAKDVKGDVIMTPEKTMDLCCTLLRTKEKSDIDLLKKIVTAQNKDGNFIVAPQVVDDVLNNAAILFTLQDMVDLFQVKSKTGQSLVSAESFHKLSDMIRNKTNPMMAIFSKTSPQKYQSNLDALDTIQKFYTSQNQNNTFQALKKMAGRD